MNYVYTCKPVDWRVCAIGGHVGSCHDNYVRGCTRVCVCVCVCACVCVCVCVHSLYLCLFG